MTQAGFLRVENPQPTDENRPFWDAVNEHRFVLPRCRACEAYIWYPRSFCPQCQSTDVAWVEASGKGLIYAYTVSRRGTGPWRDVAPYVISYVELDEGPRVLTNIVDCDPDQLAIGQRVEVAFDDGGEGYSMFRFRPAPGSPS